MTTLDGGESAGRSAASGTAERPDDDATDDRFDERTGEPDDARPADARPGTGTEHAEAGRPGGDDVGRPGGAVAPAIPAPRTGDRDGTPPPARSSGRRTAASVALAVAIVATGGVAVGYLVAGESPAPVAAPASPAPAAPAPANAAPASPAPAAPASPAPAAPTGSPVLTDTSGAPLPAPVAAGVNSIYADLSSGDLDALAPSYVPSRTVHAAPWPTVAGLLGDQTNRAALLGALRTAPTHVVDGWRYTAPTGDQVGIDLQGHIGFVRLS